MWQTIVISALVVTFLRIFPAFFKIASQIDNFPRFSKFLSYLICLITGEIIYSVAFSEINKYSSPKTMVLIIIATILLAAFMMYKTGKLSKSFIVSLIFFISSYMIGTSKYLLNL